MMCKLLKTLTKDHMVDFFVRYTLLNPPQHGFLKTRLCLTNTLCFLEEITKGLDERSPVDFYTLRFSESCHIKDYYLN